MGIHNPLPASCSWLLLTLPMIGYLSYRWLRRGLRNLWAVRVLTPGLTLASWLTCIHIFSYVSHSYVKGLTIASFVLAAIGGVFWLYDRKSPLPSNFPAGVYHNEAPSHWMWITALLSGWGISPAVINHNFHDELPVTGHQSIVAAIQNNIYPPHNLSFPQFELGYHYGFNLLAATLTAMFRLPIYQAIDVVTLFAWMYVWCVLWMVGDKMFGKKWGILPPAILLLGGGYSYYNRGGLAPPTSVGDYFFASGSVDGLTVSPPISSYFFQHPWTLGIPLGACIILVFLETQAPRKSARLLCLAAFAFTLSFSQFALFLSMVPSLVVAETLTLKKIQWKQGLILGLTLASMLLISSRFGAFFAPKDDTAFGLVANHGITKTLLGSLEWHIWTFGLLLPFGIIGLFIMKERFLFAPIVIGSLWILNNFKYRYTWDIVKFGTIAEIALAFATCAFLVWMKKRSNSTFGLVFFGTSLLAILLPGLTFMYAFQMRIPGIPVAYVASKAELPPDHEQAANWLRETTKGQQLIYIRLALARSYANLTGLPQVWVDNSEGFPFSRDRINKRNHLTSHPNTKASVYLSENIRYFVLDEHDSVFNVYANLWIKKGEAEVVKEFHKVRIIHLKSPPFNPISN
jgi:hypothetical protein